jgi:CheY-like chemotaxis protein
VSGAKPILIADDYADDAVFLKRSIEKAGLQNPVYSVNDGAKVLAWLQGEGIYANRDNYPLPAVLFIDLKMPARDGFAVLRWLKERHEFDGMLVVVLTGDQHTEKIPLAYELGADTFLTKPCRKEDVENLIRHFTEYWVPARAQ